MVPPYRQESEADKKKGSKKSLISPVEEEESRYTFLASSLSAA